MTTPKVGDTIFISKDEKVVISSVNIEREICWAADDTLTYFFEDLQKRRQPNAWLLTWFFCPEELETDEID